MNGLFLVIISALVFVLAYRFYGAFIATKVLAVNQYKVTPAFRFEDGHDYVPTNKYVVFGHHFAAIAGAGPLVGPVIAAQFGYLPGALWILIGGVLAGSVHDMVILFASMRYDGKSIAEIAKHQMGGSIGLVTSLAVLFLNILAMAGMAVVIVNALHDSPWGTFTIGMTIPIAVFIGIYMHYLRPGKIREGTVIGVVLTLLAVVLGPSVAASPTLAPLFTISAHGIGVLLIIYGFVAAAMPVWILLAPRDYLSTYMKIGTIGALALGIIIVMPTIQMPAVTQFVSGGGPVITGPVIPYIFITIACGAISGFHCMISTGTTPKMLMNERSILPVGYGAMLTECFVGMMALIAATSLIPNDYFAINSTAEHFAALNMPVVDLPQLSHMVGEDVAHRPGGAVSLAVGMAFIFSSIPGLDHLMNYWYHFCIMFEALFIMTLIDAGTRVGRYLLQELLGHFHPKFNDQHWAPGVYGCAALICILWGYLVLQGNIGIIWPLFGVSNQLLGTMTLAVGTTVIMRLGRKRYAWVTGIPCILMAIVAIAADFENVFNSYVPAGKWVLVAFSAAMFLMILIVLVEAVRSWIRLSNIPQDYRTQEEIEAESLVKYGKGVKA